VANPIQIFGDFDGGNPKDPENIIQNGPNSFTIIPFSEDNDPNYKFRLDVKACNPFTEAKTVKLIIDWQEREFIYLKNYVYVKHSSEQAWHYLALNINSSHAVGEIKLPPGETYLALHPKYSYLDYLNLIDNIPDKALISKVVLGKTGQGRNITMLHLPGGTLKTNKKILLIARIHPYETAGSYSAKGIVEAYLNTDGGWNIGIEKGTDIYLIPMANPDGVYNGFCKRTAKDGLDISKVLDFKDPTAAAIKNGIDQVRPDLYCEFHNWMFKNLDGIYHLNRLLAWKFMRAFPSQRPSGKKWRTFHRFWFKKVHPVGFKKYSSEKFNSVCLALEFPWFGRSIDEMKKIGVQTITSLAKLLNK
jgi:hypothetical protein